MKTKNLFILIMFIWCSSCHKDETVNNSNTNTTGPTHDYRLKFVGHYHFEEYDYNVNYMQPNTSSHESYNSKITIDSASTNYILIYDSDTLNYSIIKIDTNGVMENKQRSMGAWLYYSNGHFIGNDSVYFNYG